MPAVPSPSLVPLTRRLGRAVRQARRTRRWTQADVAARVGVSVQFYGRLERGQAEPSVLTLARLAAALDLCLDAVFIGAADGAAAEPMAQLARCLERAPPDVLGLLHRLLDILIVPASAGDEHFGPGS